MKKPNYTIQDLEQYLRQKKEGFTDPVLAQRIKNDDFLQTLLIGLEKELAFNKTETIAPLMDLKKEKIWLSLSPTIHTLNTAATFPETNTSNRISNWVNQQLSSWNYDWQSFRIHLMLGFNCSCIIILLVTACWLNALHESPTLVIALDELAGYKP